MKERGACRSWPMPAHCANERLGFLVSLACGSAFGKKKKKQRKWLKKKKKKKKNTEPVQPEGLGQFS